MTDARGGSPSPTSSASDPPHREQQFEVLEQSATIGYRSELIRKAIHLCSLSIPVIYHFITRQRALELLVPLTLVALVLDFARHVHPATANWFYRSFGFLLRSHERDKRVLHFNGATFLLLASTLCVFVFPRPLVVTAIAVLIIADSTSALIGRRFGKHRFLRKSLEGSAAFFLSASVVTLLAPKVTGNLAEYVIGIIAALVATVVEAAPLNIDDNLSVPLSICLTMWLLFSWLLPSANLGPLF